jgi:NADH:ubiquinone oxidoreductase subunit E
MFYQHPVGKWHLEVCTNLSCRLRGADQIVDTIKDKLGIDVGETTADKKFTLSRAECLASCGTAPMLQLNHDRYYENLTPESVLKLIDELSSRGD